MSLGPQCLQCKKRRVKCGSEQPKCLKCARDGYACPGYTKALVWVDATQPRSQKSTNTSIQQKAWSLPLPSSAMNHPDTLSVARSGLPNLTRTLAQADKQTLDFMDAITFCMWLTFASTIHANAEEQSRVNYNLDSAPHIGRRDITLLTRIGLAFLSSFSMD